MLKEQQTKQRAYIDLITQKAKIEAQRRLTSGESLFFDPQGRVLIDIKLVAAEQQQFNALGHNPTPVTTVSLDVIGDPELSELEEEYKKQYHLTVKQSEVLNGIRGSIIPLQQEFHFHLALAARTYSDADSHGRFPKAQMIHAHESAVARVHHLITQAVQDAFQKATDKQTEIIDDVAFVSALNKARKSILAESHMILTEEVVKATGVILTKKEAKELNLKHTAEINTATPNDVVHIDRGMGQTILISGSEVTAHHRGLGEKHLADRRLITIAHDEIAQTRARIQIRTPSLDVKEKITPEAAVADVEMKLNHINDKYEIGRTIGGENFSGVNAFTYNLYTALNDRFEGSKNKQSQGAQYILIGAHNFNATQLSNKNEEPPVFCLVQNISVNGFGDPLGYGRNALRNEATLMAELSMLHHLVVKDDAQRANVAAAFEAYKSYLRSENRPHFFSQSKEGNEAIQYIQKVKEGWANTQGHATNLAAEQLQTADYTVESAKLAIKAMMANNLHQTQEYAKLIQSMSVFIENASIGGCKSGNERAQAINGRVAVLDSVASKKDDPLVKAIEELAYAIPREITIKAAALKQQLDIKYDHHLQSGASIVSLVDQGAAAKVNAKRGFASLFNRNYAEESSLDHLQQSKAGKMQAHKGLTKEMSQSWDGPAPKGYFEFAREKWGAVLGTMAAVLLWPVTLYQHQAHIKSEQASFLNKLEHRQEEYQHAALNIHDKLASPLEETPVHSAVDKTDVLSTVVAASERETLNAKGGDINKEQTILESPNQSISSEPAIAGDWRKVKGHSSSSGEERKLTSLPEVVSHGCVMDYKDALKQMKQTVPRKEDELQEQIGEAQTRQLH